MPDKNDWATHTDEYGVGYKRGFEDGVKSVTQQISFKDAVLSDPEMSYEQKRDLLLMVAEEKHNENKHNKETNTK